MTVSEVAVAADTLARVRPKLTLFSAGTVENPVPVTVTVVSAAPAAGLNPVTVGAATPGSTVNVCELVVESEAVATVTVPVVAPDGTVTVRRVAVAAVTVAVVPLNLTVLAPVVVAKPVPPMVTFAPVAARLGFTPAIVSAPAAERVTPVTLPASS